MHLIEGMLSRKSQGKLTEPAPTQQEINVALNCGFRAPDHGRLRPWKFYLIQGDARQRLGECFCMAAQEKARKDERELTEKQKERFLSMPFRAPLVISVVAQVKESKISKLDQCLAVGAAVQNLQLAFHALGYGCIWRTGEMVNAQAVKHAFNATTEDEIIAFLYVGKPTVEIPVQTTNTINEQKDLMPYSQISEQDAQSIHLWEAQIPE